MPDAIDEGDTQNRRDDYSCEKGWLQSQFQPLVFDRDVMNFLDNFLTFLSQFQPLVYDRDVKNFGDKFFDFVIHPCL